MQVVPCLGYLCTIESEFTGVVFKDFSLFPEQWNTIFFVQKRVHGMLFSLFQDLWVYFAGHFNTSLTKNELIFNIKLFKDV